MYKICKHGCIYCSFVYKEMNRKGKQKQTEGINYK